MTSNHDLSRRWGAIASICAIAAAFASCGVIADFSGVDAANGGRVENSDGTGTITVRVSPGSARTVVPDAILSARSYAVAYDNRTNPSFSGRASALTGPTLTVSGVYPGSIAVTVYAYSSLTAQDASTLIASGTSDAFTLGKGGTANVTVALKMNQTPSITSGSFSLDLSWPLSTGASHLTAMLYDEFDTLKEDIERDGAPGTTAYSTNVSPTRALASGTYRLQLTFINPNPSAHMVGTFNETINVYDGLTSTRWIDPTGTLVPTRAFSEGDFAVAGTSVRVTTVKYVNGAAIMEAHELAPDGARDFALSLTNNDTMRIIPEPGVSGQTITAAVNGDPIPAPEWGVFSFLTLGEGANSIAITVTAPDGTSETPYAFTIEKVPDATGIIATQDDLELIRLNPDGDYVLDKDIPFTGTWFPIDNFTGSLDGYGHSVTGLVISPDGAPIGLIGYNYGEIRNLVISGATVTSTYTVNEANCGLLVGTNYGRIIRCATSGTITDGGRWRIGGLAGNNFNPGEIHECYSSAIIRTDDTWFTGGLVGTNQSILTDSYARGSVRGSRLCGGLVGTNETANGMVNRCYSTGLSEYNTPSQPNGGCTGDTSGGARIEVSFYDGDTSGFPSGGVHGVARDTTPMKSIENYTAAGWDFDAVWGIDPAINDGYPYLRYFRDNAVILLP